MSILYIFLIIVGTEAYSYYKCQVQKLTSFFFNFKMFYSVHILVFKATQVNINS